MMRLIPIYFFVMQYRHRAFIYENDGGMYRVP
jgi:hypothetical protein